MGIILTSQMIHCLLIKMNNKIVHIMLVKKSTQVTINMLKLTCPK
jgi:hypothetical protein